jgi:flagellar basal body-associated protein FliL
MKIILYILLVLFSISFVFICFMWFLSHASGHNIPDRTDIEAYCLMVLNVLIIIFLKIRLKKISEKS